MQARPGIEPAPAWQSPRGELRRSAIQHNGRLHPTWPVARKARLVAPLDAIPVMSCAPRRLRARSAGSRGVARSPRANCMVSAVSAAPKPQAPGQRACGASTTNTTPAHPGPRSRAAARRPRRCAARGPPHCPARGCAALGEHQRLRAAMFRAEHLPTKTPCPGRDEKLPAVRRRTPALVGQNVPLGKIRCRQGGVSSS